MKQPLNENIGLPVGFIDSIDENLLDILDVEDNTPSIRNNIRKEIMELKNRMDEICEGLTPEIVENIVKTVILSKFQIISENQLDLKIVEKGGVLKEIPDLKSVPATPKNSGISLDVVDNKPELVLDENNVDIEEIPTELLLATQKVKIANLIIQGESKQLNKFFRNKLTNKLLSDVIGSDRAKELIDILIRINDLNFKLDCLVPIEKKVDNMANKTDNMSGATQLNWDNNSCSSDNNKVDDFVIKAVAVDMHILFHEAVKGVYEIVLSSYLPSESDSEDVINLWDEALARNNSFLDEVEDLKYGKFVVYEFEENLKLLNLNKDVPNLKEVLYTRLIELDNFLDVFRGFLEGDKESINTSQKIIDDYVSEYLEYLKGQEIKSPIDMFIDTFKQMHPNSEIKIIGGFSTGNPLINNDKPKVVKEAKVDMTIDTIVENITNNIPIKHKLTVNSLNNFIKYCISNKNTDLLKSLNRLDNEFRTSKEIS